jgi:hypothetical protein
MPKVSHCRRRNENPIPTVPVPLTAEEFDKAFDEIADIVPDHAPPLSDEAMSRGSIYTREDQWDLNQEIRLLMQIVVSILVFIAALYVILSGSL